MAKLKLAVVVGSNRRESINRKLAQALTKLGGAAFDANFVQIDGHSTEPQGHEPSLGSPLSAEQGRMLGRLRLWCARVERAPARPPFPARRTARSGGCRAHRDRPVVVRVDRQERVPGRHPPASRPF